jgi:hypothetical protein
MVKELEDGADKEPWLLANQVKLGRANKQLQMVVRRL